MQTEEREDDNHANLSREMKPFLQYMLSQAEAHANQVTHTKGMVMNEPI